MSPAWPRSAACAITASRRARRRRPWWYPRFCIFARDVDRWQHLAQDNVDNCQHRRRPMDGVVETRRIVTPIGVLHAEVRGSGPAVFCWPSLYCDARTLDPLVLDLARDHRTIVVDGPGHGHSGPGSRSFSLNDCADAAMQVLDAVGAAQVVWLGAAWGGHIGVAAARRHPDRLFGLVVLNAPMRPWRGRRLALMRLTYLL